jgi:hypothetical protein
MFDHLRRQRLVAGRGYDVVRKLRARPHLIDHRTDRRVEAGLLLVVSALTPALFVQAAPAVDQREHIGKTFASERIAHANHRIRNRTGRRRDIASSSVGGASPPQLTTVTRRAADEDACIALTNAQRRSHDA